jgi:hypothetical protein
MDLSCHHQSLATLLGKICRGLRAHMKTLVISAAFLNGSRIEALLNPMDPTDWTMVDLSVHKRDITSA